MLSQNFLEIGALIVIPAKAGISFFFVFPTFVRYGSFLVTQNNCRNRVNEFARTPH
jgi:hypothetical protein